MNPYLVAVIVIIVASWALGAVSRYLNDRHLKPEPPEEFRGVVDDDYKLSQDYARANMRLESVSDAVSTVAVVGFILLGGFNAVDAIARSLQFGPTITGLIFFGILGILSSVMGLPFSIYHTFVIENEYGFNATSWKTFVADRIKGAILATLLGAPLLGALLWFFREAGDNAWLLCWGFTTLFSLGVTFIAPRYILPLFNTFTPLEEGKLRSAIEDYAIRQGFTVSGLFVIDGSRRSSKANAFFTGFGATKRIALFDTLMEKLEDREILGVLAHEVGHSKLGHIRKMLISSTLKSGLMFYLLGLVLTHEPLYAGFGMEHTIVHAGLVLFGLLYTPVSTILGVVANVMSRKHEWEADRFAAETTGDPKALATGLRTLSLDSLSNLTPHPFTVFMEYSHPPVADRIRMLKSMK